MTPAAPGRAAAWTLAALIGLGSITGLFVLGQRLQGQLLVLAADRQLEARQYQAAAVTLQQAAGYLPADFALFQKMGELYHQLASQADTAAAAAGVLASARAAFETAQALNPLEAKTYYNLAKSAVLGERIAASAATVDPHPPVQSLAYFREAVRLRPNSPLYRFSYARDLARQNRKEALVSEVRTLGRIYPPVYRVLKKEPFWDEAVSRAFIEGLQEAVVLGIAPRLAHQNLAAIYDAARDWDGAIRHYRDSLTFEPHRNGANDYLHLGRLCLKNGMAQEAGDAFLQGLAISRSREQDLEGIYHAYRQAGLLVELSGFYDQVARRHALDDRLDILRARVLIDRELYEEARILLEGLSGPGSRGQVFYWLARLAEKQQDWDAMELSAQKATVREPSNSQYHQLFSIALHRKNKAEAAEAEADLAIGLAEQPSCWLYNHRGWVRWSREDAAGALADWQEAVRLEPSRPGFYEQIARAHRQLGNAELAAKFDSEAAKIRDGKT